MQPLRIVTLKCRDAFPLISQYSRTWVNLQRQQERQYYKLRCFWRQRFRFFLFSFFSLISFSYISSCFGKGGWILVSLALFPILHFATTHVQLLFSVQSMANIFLGIRRYDIFTSWRRQKKFMPWVFFLYKGQIISRVGYVVCSLAAGQCMITF